MPKKKCDNCGETKHIALKLDKTGIFATEKITTEEERVDPETKKVEKVKNTIIRYIRDKFGKQKPKIPETTVEKMEKNNPEFRRKTRLCKDCAEKLGLM